MWIAVGLYLLVGLLRVGSDFFAQPYFNRPLYVAERQWGRIIVYILFWPWLVIVSSDIYYFFVALKRFLKNSKS
jgi:hypothetical protein